jgi:hypothetical protein
MSINNQASVTIGLVRAAFTSAHTPILFTGAETHESALKLAAQLARHSGDDEHIHSIIVAALPENYSGNTIRELREMIAGARRKRLDAAPVTGAGQKRKAIDILCDLFEQSGATLFHNPLRHGYVWLPQSSGGGVNVRIASETCRQFLQELLFRRTGRALAKRDLDQFLELLTARALFDSLCFSVFVRVGGGPTLVCHDLGRDDGMAVEITAAGYRTTLQPAVKMVRAHGMRPLPPPKPGEARFFGFAKLRKLLELDEQTWPLLLAFLLSSMRPDGPYPCLAVEGEQGSGKSTICEVCKRIIDPSIPMRSSMPGSAQDMMIIASHRHMVIFDNLSSVKNDMSDALAALATKSGYETRELYSDGNLFTIEIARPFALNGIGEFIHRPDLMDRAIPLRLEAMPSGARRSEAEIWRDLELLLPELLHDLYNAIACALRNSSTTTTPTSFRMADAARWLAAAEPETGLAPGTILSEIERAQTSTQAELALSDSMFPELERVLLDGDFDGRPADLLNLLRSDERRKFDRYFPATAAQLSTKLRRLRPALAKAGIVVEFPARTRDGRHIKARLTPEARAAAEMARSEMNSRYSKGNF